MLPHSIKEKKILIFLLILLLMSIVNSYTDEVILKNKNIIKGTIIEESDEKIILQNEESQFTIKRTDILTIKKDTIYYYDDKTTKTLIAHSFVLPEFIAWRLPKFDENNTSCFPFIGKKFSNIPEVLWIFRAEGLIDLSSIVTDILFDKESFNIILGDQDGNVYCLNSLKGTIIWKKKINGLIDLASPRLFDVNEDGKPEVLVGGKSLFALNDKDGSILWENNMDESQPAGFGAGKIKATEDTVIFAGNLNPPYQIFLINGKTGKTIWKKETIGKIISHPIFVDVDNSGEKKIIFSVNILDKASRAKLICIGKNGDIAWTFSAEPSEEQLTFKPKEFSDIYDFSFISPVSSDFNSDSQNDILWGTDLNLYLISDKGNLIWKTPTGIKGNSIIEFHLGNGKIIFTDSGVQIRDVAIDSPLNKNLPIKIAYGLSSDSRMVTYENSRKFKYKDVKIMNKFCILDSKNGTKIWDYENPPNKTDCPFEMAHPIFVDLNGDFIRDIIILSSDLSIYGVDGQTHKEIFKLPLLFPSGRYLSLTYFKENLYLFFTMNTMLFCAKF